jgi:undecaprenyl-diphosphatase
LVAVAVTVVVAVSRVYRGEHHPTDVMAGVLLGAASLWMATGALRAAAAATTGRTPKALPRSAQPSVSRSDVMAAVGQ